MPDQYEQLVEADEPTAEQRADVRIPLLSQPLYACKNIAEYRGKIVESGEFASYKSQTPVADDIPILFGTGSSSLEDVEGDKFHPPAIKGLVEKSVNLNVLLGHQREMPKNLFGGVFESGHRFIEYQGKQHAAVRLGVDLQVDNENAVKTHDYIVGKKCRPKEFGLSVGAVYTDCRRRFNKSLNAYHGLDIFGATPVEYSVTPLPANRLAWIDFVTKDLRLKGILPKQAPGGWLNDEVQYILVNREDFVDDADPSSLVNWNNLNKLAMHLDRHYGIKMCRPRIY